MKRQRTFPPALPPEDPDELLEDEALERALLEISSEIAEAARREREGDE